MDKMNLYAAEKIKREFDASLDVGEPYATRQGLKDAHFYELLTLAIDLLRQKAEMGK